MISNLKSYLNSGVAVTTDEMTLRALEDPGVGIELIKTNLEMKNSQIEELHRAINTNRTVGNFAGEFSVLLVSLLQHFSQDSLAFL